MLGATAEHETAPGGLPSALGVGPWDKGCCRHESRVVELFAEPCPTKLHRVRHSQERFVPHPGGQHPTEVRHPSLDRALCATNSLGDLPVAAALPEVACEVVLA